MADPWTRQFVAASRSYALRNDGADGSTLKAYFRAALEYVDPEIFSALGRALSCDNPEGPTKIASLAMDNSLALDQMHFVYMDVGCWAGDGGTEGWTMHREFGVVYGHVVVLCAFAKKATAYQRYANAPIWDKSRTLRNSITIDPAVAKYVEWEPIKRLLDKMAEAMGDLSLFILGATAVTSGYAPVPPTGRFDPIMVFLGDLHAPAVTPFSDPHIVENGREQSKGRLDVDVPDFKPPSLAGVPPENLLVQRASWYANQAATPLDWNSTITYEAAEKWATLYHGKGKKGADIFQKAGPHLRLFVDALAAFHREDWPLELIQLGDFFDLWLGFRRAFNESIDDVFDNAKAMEFARFWVRRTLFDTEQGPHLVHLLTLSEHAGKNRRTKAPLRTHFLYGNHDNYRKHGQDTAIEVPAGREHAGRSVHAFHARAFFEKPGLWAEHGHQCDASNRDESPKVGHGATQAAFFEPAIRSLEGPVGWMTSTLENDKILRVVTIRHAMDKCLLNHLPEPSKQDLTCKQMKESSTRDEETKRRKREPCRGIYVMGHSHEPMLKRVQLRLTVPPEDDKG